MREVRVLESVPLPASGRNRTSSGRKGCPAAYGGVDCRHRRSGSGPQRGPNGKGEACGGEPFATADGSGSFIEGGRLAVMSLLPIYCNSGNRRFRVKIRFLIFSFDYLRLLDIFAAINHL